VAVISIAVETVNLGDADVLAAGAIFTTGSAAVFFFLGAAFTAGRAAAAFFFLGGDFFIFLAMVYTPPYVKILPPGTQVVTSSSERTDCHRCKKYNRFFQ
jgi:hypothetical protein